MSKRLIHWATALLLSPALTRAQSTAPATTPDSALRTPAAAEFTITGDVLRPAAKVPPLGANGFGRSGSIEWAANNFIGNSGNEPAVFRSMHRVTAAGARWFDIDGGSTSNFDLYASGFLSGATVRIYRLVDRDGHALPLNKYNYLELAGADHAELVGTTQIVPENTPEFPDGGWIANKYVQVFPNGAIRHGNTATTDTSGTDNGRRFYYIVTAVGPGGVESEPSNEVSATPLLPQAGLETPPHILLADNDPPLEMKAGRKIDFTPKVFAGRAPFTWQLLDSSGQAFGLPDGLRFDGATGRVTGTPAADAAADTRAVFRVTDAQGRTDSRTWSVNPSAPTGDAAAKTKPLPPTDLIAVAGDNCVTLTWKASPSANVVHYKLKRSSAPAGEQQTRAYVLPGAPAMEKLDYIVLEKKFDRFDMRWVNPRVRGIGNLMHVPAWHWDIDQSRVTASLVPHPQPIPPELTEPGERCLQLVAGPGPQTMRQLVFIGTKQGKESLWYGQLEPGRRYQLEVWLRQAGLGNSGTVRFGFADGYPDLRQDFQVTDQWGKYTYSFVAPERPTKPMHFGPTFTFSGPGTLWLDNARLARLDNPEDAAKPYVPNPTVLNELLASQPAAGPKGAHRTWYLNRHATMASLLSWHSNAQVNPNWRTSIQGTLDMTLPMGLSFDLATGPDAGSRMRPWLVLQHLLHSEQDWRNFIEYLAAPYVPGQDTPQSKPWAYRRVLQRGGVTTPWTEEFASITVEFGNETWHNGVFPDWLGFAMSNQVTQGGPEYGYFTRYLIENMKKSPYWAPQHLERKIRFALGGFYNGSVNPQGRVVGYGEEAIQKNPLATDVSHANYTGPKWETGDYSARHYDEHGLQECLLSFLTGNRLQQARMQAAREALAQAGIPYDITAYEGGPGGYALPGQAAPEQAETNEQYGKSLAQAVGALDCWLGSYAQGWTDQCFYQYGQGTAWNSHTIMAEGFRPHAAWLALTLRNRHASGDLVTVTANAVPTIERRKEALPLVGVYAFHAKNAWSVVVLSRSLKTAIPTTLHLPFAAATKITLHQLGGPPGATNRSRQELAIESQEIPAVTLQDGTFQLTAPPGCILLYRFQNHAP